ncbi:MAG: hypothetical protein KFB96_10425 [Thiocapsa sp.]|uniref:hypothetical protein n=1 Tax=Thiocapsa sp. TaxID=2024551 RepID=UPI001BCF0A98|nr:hypothetical protein [Thiocapsa sp.]QVL50773.1 MAG: hypothetical protein KFB96_10425 [Thiocapsa sp.]
MKLTVASAAVTLWSVALIAAVAVPLVIRPAPGDGSMAVAAVPAVASVDAADWHSRNTVGGCFPSTPAEHVESTRGNASQPVVNETRDQNGNLIKVEFTHWFGLAGQKFTFYRTKANCEAAIAEAEHIPSEYR